MKKLSIKMKLMIATTGIIIFFTLAVLLILGIITNASADHTTKDTLQRIVKYNVDEIDYINDTLDISNEFTILKNEIHCVAMLEDKTVLEGIVPLHDLLLEKLENGKVRHVKVNGEWYYLYDICLTHQDHPDIWIRGSAPVSGNTINLTTLKMIILITIPLLIILAAVCAYLVVAHSLKPIREIRHTAEEVSKSGDLSRRIELKSEDELGQLADTFNQMFDRLETNFEAERQFTSDASHELRTPIAVILAQCEYAFDHAADELELYECIGSIQNQGKQMSKMVESLLAFTRLEQNMVPLQLQMTNVSQLTEHICSEQRLISEKNILLSYQLEPDIMLKADENLYTVMLTNLIRNAYQYGKLNGQIQVSLKTSSGCVILSVKDDGMGISKEDLPKIWNRFYRADKARSSEHKGLGLGLSMVQKIVQLHGARIEVESTFGHGSTFTIYF